MTEESPTPAQSYIDPVEWGQVVESIRRMDQRLGKHLDFCERQVTCVGHLKERMACQETVTGGLTGKANAYDRLAEVESGVRGLRQREFLPFTLIAATWVAIVGLFKYGK